MGTGDFVEIQIDSRIRPITAGGMIGLFDMGDYEGLYAKAPSTAVVWSFFWPTFPGGLALEDLAFLRAGGISGNAIESLRGKKIDITEW